MSSELTPGILPYPLAERGNIIIKGRDSDALAIGENYRKARASAAESVRPPQGLHAERGRRHQASARTVGEGRRERAAAARSCGQTSIYRRLSLGR